MLDKELNQSLINKAINLTSDIMSSDKSGHGMDHIMRTYKIAMKIAKTEDCNPTLVALGAILHDVDDYKLFGLDAQANLPNTRKILQELNLDETTINSVIDIIKSIGYKKRLSGIVPSTIEAKIVSDADMCEAVGVNGILRTHQYNILHNSPFFDRNAWPIEDMSSEKYTRICSDSSVCHLFEKGLKLKNLMLTKSGKIEAEKRHNITVLFLKALFDEEDADDWTEYLNNFLKKQESTEI